jgi:hypothetical protein
LDQLLKYFFVLLITTSLSAQSFPPTSLKGDISASRFRTDSNYKARRIVLLTGTAALTTGSLIYLNEVWYKPYSTGKFHFFDDSEEWLQMDKAGHVLTNFQISRVMMETFRWAGFPKKQQVLLGGSMGFAYMTAIEVMDGYSQGWRFSWSDMAANAIGTGLAIGQKKLWNEQRINLKFSFHQSPYAKYKPELLGSGLGQEIIKDYNGQTYWLSVSPFCFFSNERKLPRWLAISLGYGAEGMLGARYNNIVVTDDQGNVVPFNRRRNFYFSLDVDFSKIKTRSKVLKAIFNTMNIIKVPFPTFGFSNSNGVTTFDFNSFYF